jgi:uncharacterized protein (TIGR02246 family)
MHVRFLGDDVAILHTRFWIKGEVMQDALSQQDRESVGTRVLRKIDGRWHIVATQNTDVRHGRRH